MSRRIVIVGSRRFDDTQQVVDYIKNLPTDVEVVSGGAAGVDTLAVVTANERGIKTTVFEPQYDLYGNVAPLERNKQMVLYGDQIVAFWDGRSKGTHHTITYARRVGKPLLVQYSTIESTDE